MISAEKVGPRLEQQIGREKMKVEGNTRWYSLPPPGEPVLSPPSHIGTQVGCCAHCVYRTGAACYHTTPTLSIGSQVDLGKDQGAAAIATAAATRDPGSCPLRVEGRSRCRRRCRNPHSVSARLEQLATPGGTGLSSLYYNSYGDTWLPAAIC